MAKRKKKIPRCKKCGRREVFGLLEGEIEFSIDQEPYVDGVIEPVIVGKEEVETVNAYVSLLCHICPKCGSTSEFL